MSKSSELNKIILAWWWAERFDSGNLPTSKAIKQRDGQMQPLEPGGKGSVAFIGVYDKTILQQKIAEDIFGDQNEIEDDYHQMGFSFAVSLSRDLAYEDVQVPYATYLMYAIKQRKRYILRDSKGYEQFKEYFKDFFQNKLSKVKTDEMFEKLIGIEHLIRQQFDLGESLDFLYGFWNYRSKPLMMESFYADDLQKVIDAKNDDPLIRDYLLGTDHREINEDWPFLISSVSVRNMPMGKWPSEVEFSSSLMQQFAINAITGHLGDPHNYIRTVNGPPGTGKTTLLKDVFAEMVVQQAAQMAKLSTPAKGFQRARKVRVGKYYHLLYPLAPALQGYGIVVTSNNNSAVENISKDFPMIGEIKQHAAKDADNDFAKNIKRVNFFKSLAGKILAKDDKEPEENAWGTFAIPMGRSAKTRKAMSYSRNLWGSLVHHKTTPGQWKKAVYFFKQKYKKVEALQSQLVEALSSGQYSTLEKWDALDNDTKQLTVPYSLNPDGPQENDLNEKLRDAQAELFIEALSLRKKFMSYPIKDLEGEEHFPVLEAYEILDDERLVSTDSYVVQAFQVLQLLFPVISSTLASFHRMFKRFGENSLDNVFMDEAGQAVPLSGVGAIWRAKHFIALGDPAQIKPVVTNNPHFLEFIAVEKKVDYNRYLNPDLSVQELADQANYFGHQEKAGEPWIGMPLWVHRRCLDPMFSISNAISYHNHMVMGTHQSAKDHWNSQWINSVGRASDKFVKADADNLIKQISQRLTNKKLSPVKLNDIFVISPFTNVVGQLRRHLKKSSLETNAKWLHGNIGTVHTFQGKEAKVVYLVVGTDRTSDGAANWSCQEPNLINVAVTRAKKEFYVIGDAQRLRKKPNYSVVYQLLNQ